MLIAAATDPEVGRIFYEKGTGRAVKFLEAYFALVIEAGKIRQADPYIVARHFHALLDAEVLYLGLYNIKSSLDDTYIAEVVDRAVDVFLRAYQAPPLQQ
jgi:hypothetical protein